MDMLDNIQESISSDFQGKIAELEDEIKSLQENNPYNVSDKLAKRGFESAFDAVYRYYTNGIKDGNAVEYYIQIRRDNGKRFKINYAWCVKEDDEYNVVTEIFSSTKTIFEDKNKRNNILCKYTKEYNLPGSEKDVREFLDETWDLIFKETDYLKILKDKNTEFHRDKYSCNSIMQEYIVLSDVVIDKDYEFRMLYVHGESYTLFSNNTNNGIESVVATFKWQNTPFELLNADETDAKIQLLFEKLQSINRSFDVFKIKDELLKSLLELDKDMNKKMELLNNASSVVKSVMTDVVDTLRTKHFDDLKTTIKNKLNKHKTPNIQMLVDYLNSSDEFYAVHDIKKKFKRTKNGFEEITPKDISNFFNNEFGFNKINMKKCNECMDYITRDLKINYDVIQFQNGIYNTRTCEFMENTFSKEYIPKLNLTGFKYHENAKDKFRDTPLYNEIHAILKTDRENWKDWNEHIFFKSIGSCYCGVNTADKMFILVGDPGTRKSTLLTIIRRIFGDNCCNKKIQEVVKNERFDLIPTINKSILIDDDASDLQLKNIGPLNSFISGTGLYVEIKNENDGVRLNENNTPRIWCASNKPFNVIGSGFKRRLCLILCDNVFDKNKSTKEYMVGINNGERDNELELLISYCLQVYASERDSAFLTETQEKVMFNEFEFRSYPERQFVKEVFTYGDEFAEELEGSDDVKEVNERRWCITYQDTSCVDGVGDGTDNDTNASISKIVPTIIKIKDMSTICRKYLRYQRDKGTISQSQITPSANNIRTALEMFGYNQASKNIVTSDGKRSSIRVYENIVIKQEWIEKLHLESLVDKILYDDLNNKDII